MVYGFLGVSESLSEGPWGQTVFIIIRDVFAFPHYADNCTDGAKAMVDQNGEP